MIWVVFHLFLETSNKQQNNPGKGTSWKLDSLEPKNGGLFCSDVFFPHVLSVRPFSGESAGSCFGVVPVYSGYPHQQPPMTCNFAACSPRPLIGSRLALLASLNNAKSKVESIPEMVILPVIQPWQKSKTSPETNQI